MDRTQQLAELVEQAASKVTLLDSSTEQDRVDLNRMLEHLCTLTAECNDAGELIEALHRISVNATSQMQKLIDSSNETSAEQIDAIAAGIMEMQQLLEQAATTNDHSPAGAAFSSEDIPLIQDFIAESREHIESAEKALLELESDPKNSEVLNQIFRSFHTIKGMAGFLNLSDINALAHAAENLLDLARKGQLLLTDVNSDAVFASIDKLKEMLGSLEKAIQQGGSPSTPAGLDDLLGLLAACANGSTPPAAIAEALAQKPAPAAPTPNTQPEKPKSDLPQGSNASSNATTTQAAEKIKVDTAKLDELINMTGELAIAQLMISEEVKKAVRIDSDLFRKIAQQDKIVRELQELSMSMRMVPIQGAFQKMSRLVRDLSKKAGKNVQFISSGEETELDRNIVDKITDPLVHMMRNSVDHGIETPQERIAKGKSECGQIRLDAYHQAGGIVIEIQDDGRGLNKEKLIKKAVEKGLMAEHQELSDEQAFQLIFHAGLSTAEKLSDISGRGVGMDVVRKNIESLGGKIDIRSVPDQGTTFIVRLPLTLAVIDGQIVTVGDQRYIIPITSIVGSIRPAAEQIFTVQGRGEGAMIRGELIRLVRTGRLFGVADAVENPGDALLVVVEEGGRKCALLVDDLVGQQQVVIKNLSGLGKVKGISGGAIMGDGRISLILDIPGLIDLSLSGTR